MSLLYCFEFGSSHQPISFLITIFFILDWILTLSFLYKINLILYLPSGVIKSPSFLLSPIPLLPMEHFAL